MNLPTQLFVDGAWRNAASGRHTSLINPATEAVFAEVAALIGLPQLRSIPVMPADLQETPVPLAEISQGPNAFEQFLDRNQKNIIILAILIAIGVAAFVIYRGIETSRQETAGAALNKAEDLAALQAVITEHADTTAARSAMVLLADRQWTEGQQDAAKETCPKFNPSTPGAPARSRMTPGHIGPVSDAEWSSSSA